MCHWPIQAIKAKLLASAGSTGGPHDNAMAEEASMVFYKAEVAYTVRAGKNRCRSGTVHTHVGGLV